VHAENNIIGGTHADDAGNVWYLNEASLYENNDTVAGSTGSSHVVFLDDAWGEFKNCIYWNPGCENEFISAHLIDHCSVTDPDVADPAKNNTLGDGNLIGVDPMIIGGDEHDPRLMLGSPCIDAADPDTAADDDFFGVSRPLDGDGDGVALPDMGACERAALKLGEYSGDDRYDTAAMIALENFESAELAIVASGANFPDALSAAGLAGAYRTPLLLTRPDSVPDALADALDTLGVTDVIIIGGEVAISGAVATDLDKAGYAVERVGGADRYETAADVARRIATQMGDEFTHSAFLARGDAFPDALAVSPFAYSDRSPILLTRPGALPDATADVVTELDIMHGAVIGGTVAVSAEVKTDFDGLLAANGGSAAERWFGADRYATAVDVAENGVASALASWDYVGIATGENYPDALAGGVGAGVKEGVVVLTGTSYLPAVTHDLLADRAPVVMYVDVFGGPVAVFDVVRAAIKEALGW
jgi:putative cell wall-binding protein